MSDTPRTDARYADLLNSGTPKSYIIEQLVEHADELERELAAMAAKRDALGSALKRLVDMPDDRTLGNLSNEELDAWKEAASSLKQNGKGSDHE